MSNEMDGDCKKMKTGKVKSNLKGEEMLCNNNSITWAMELLVNFCSNSIKIRKMLLQ